MKSIKFGLLGALLATMSQVVNAGEVSAAVAANFTEPMKQIVEQFQKETGHTVKLSFGSSDKDFWISRVLTCGSARSICRSEHAYVPACWHVM